MWNRSNTEKLSSKFHPRKIKWYLKFFINFCPLQSLVFHCQDLNLWTGPILNHFQSWFSLKLEQPKKIPASSFPIYILHNSGKLFGRERKRKSICLHQRRASIRTRCLVWWTTWKAPDFVIFSRLRNNLIFDWCSPGPGFLSQEI